MNTWMLLAQVGGDSADRNLGQLVANILLVVFIVAAILACARIMRRPTSSTLGVLALLLVFAAFAVNGLWGIVFQVASPPAQLWALNFVVSVPVLVAALVLAIIALVDYDSQLLKQGRVQAVWAILLSLGCLAASSKNVAAALAELNGAQVSVPPIGAPGDEAVRSEFNFAIKPPDASWRPVEATLLAPNACAAFRWTEEDLYAAIVAEEILSLKYEGIEPYIRTVKDNIAKQVVREQTQDTVKLGGLEFTRLRSRFWNEKLKTETAIEHWLATHNGYAWQIVVWALAKDKAHVAEQAQALLNGFRVLDMDRVTPACDRLVDVERPVLGYSTKLSGLGWRSWALDDDGESSPKPLLSDLAVRSLSASFSITPYEHRMEGPPPPMEALARAFLSAQKFAYDRDGADFSTRTLSQPLPGLEITMEGVIGDHPSRCLYRIHQSGRWAWCVGGGILNLKGSTVDRLRAACNAVAFKVPEPPPASTVSASEPSPQRLDADAEFINQIGLWYHDAGELADAARYFHEARRMRPDNQTYLDNTTYALEAAERAGEALKIMDAASGQPFAETPKHQFRHAWLRIKAGQAKEGAAEMLRLIQGGFRDSDQIFNSINLLLEQEHNQEARRLADAYAETYPTPKARLWQAQTANSVGEHDDAAKLLEQLIEDEPDYFVARYTLGEFSNRGGKYDRALEEAEFLEKEGQNTTRLHLMRGWAHMGRKWYKEAKSSFENAAKVDAEDQEVKAALQEAAAHLGQGSNLEIKTPIEAVPLPPRIASRMEDILNGPGDFGKGHNCARLLWSVAVRFTEDKPMRTTTRSVVRILNDEGAASFNTLQFNYDPLSERLFVNRVEVLGADGRVSARAAADDSYVLDSRDRTMADTDRTVHVQVPGLKEGDILDYEVTIERLGLAKDFPLKRHLFGTTVPCRLEAYSISGDVDSIQQDLLHGEKIQVTRESGSAVFELPDPPLIENEAYAQPAETWAPVLLLSAKGDTWDEVGRDYLEQIAAPLKPHPDTDAEAERLTAGLSDTRAKVRALTAFVQKSIRYKAIEFGVRGYIPDPPAQVLKQRYGDCKDQALLLHHLLRACGIESYLAMVDTEWEIDARQPSLDAFNHMIVHVPGLPVPGFIDTTSSHVAAADHTPYGLWGQKAFVLKPGRPVFQAIPGPAPDCGRVSSKRTLSLSPPNGLRVVEELTLHGYYASGMRSAFAPEEPKARFQQAQDLLHDLGNYRLENFDFLNLTDPNSPAILHFTYTMPNAIETRGAVTKLRLPRAWESKYLHIPFINDRTTPFRWRVPFQMRSEVAFDQSLPLDPGSLSAMISRQESRFGVWEMKAAGGLHFEFEIRPGQHAAADYTAFQSLWSTAQDAWTRELSLTQP